MYGADMVSEIVVIGGTDDVVRAWFSAFASLAAEEFQVTAVMEPATTTTTKTSSAKRGIRIRSGYPR